MSCVVYVGVCVCKIVIVADEGSYFGMVHFKENRDVVWALW
jgi:hypothetical protein